MKRGSRQEQPHWHDSVEFLSNARLDDARYDDHQHIDGQCTADQRGGDQREDDAESDGSAATSRRRYRALVVAVVGGAILTGLLDILSHNQAQPAKPAPVAVGASRVAGPTFGSAPQQVRIRQCPGVDCPDSDVPESDAIAAFTADVPGAILSSEHTVTQLNKYGRPVLVQRVLRMAFGNVDMTVTILRVGAREPVKPPRALVQRVTHGGYAFVVTTVGLYPPTRAQLQVLAADPRTLTIQS